MKKLVIALSLIGLAALVVACGSKGAATTGKVIKSSPAGNNLNVSFATNDGVLKHGNTEFTVSFTDAAGKATDVSKVALTFRMPQMGTMAEMNDSATLTTTNTPGVYSGRANIESAGEWQVKITYEGPAGSGQATFPIVAQ